MADAVVAQVCGSKVFAAADDDRADTLLVSDLHVPKSGGQVLEDFLTLLARARAAPATTRVLVLGDLLESIVNERQLTLGTWPRLLQGLRATTAAGVPVTVLHGNRDFMLGKGFARATGCRVLAGGLAFALGGRRVLALHGDELCTNDVPYQRSKLWLRSWPIRWMCASLTLPAAGRLGNHVRSKSAQSMARGDQERFAPVRDAVASAFAPGFEILVFGHVHTPGCGDLADGRYYVLPAFDETAVYLEHHAGSDLQFVDLRGRQTPEYGPLTFATARA